MATYAIAGNMSVSGPITFIRTYDIKAQTGAVSAPATRPLVGLLHPPGRRGNRATS